MSQDAMRAHGFPFDPSLPAGPMALSRRGLHSTGNHRGLQVRTEKKTLLGKDFSLIRSIRW